jgi:hypothetical protein
LPSDRESRDDSIERPPAADEAKTEWEGERQVVEPAAPRLLLEGLAGLDSRASTTGRPIPSSSEPCTKILHIDISLFGHLGFIGSHPAQVRELRQCMA